MSKRNLRRLLGYGLALSLIVWGWACGKSPTEDMRADRSTARSLQELLDHWEDHYRTPRDYVLDTFQTKKWVFLGEYHRIKHDVDLINGLIPALHAGTDVRILALEFICHDHQEEANALITADTYDRGQAIDFFRKQFASWSYQEYLDIFKSAWESNRKHAAARGTFRLVGLHPCVDWEVINYGEDPEAVAAEKAKQQSYDALMAAYLEDEVLEKGEKALVFTGIAHATAKFPEYYVGSEPPEQLVRMGNLVYREPYAEDMFFICLHAPFYDSGTRKDIYPFDGVLDRLMSSFQRDIGFDVIDTPFSGLLHAQRTPQSITDFEFGQLFDGYIMHKTPIKAYVGMTCIPDWITSEDEFRQFWRNLPNKEASESYSKIPLQEFLADFCSPRRGYGQMFSRRFQGLPDL